MTTKSDKESVPPSDTCNGLWRKTQKLCEKPAGWGTSHPGYGRCKSHGGNSLDLVLPGPATLKELIAARRNDVNLYDLKEELLMSRGVVDYVQKMIVEEEDLDNINGYLKTLNLFLNTTTKIIEKMHSIEKDRNQLLTVEQVKGFIDEFVNIILSEIEDMDTQERVLNRILNAKVQGVMNTPSDNMRFSDQWAMHNTDSKPVDIGEAGPIIDSMKDNIIEPDPEPDEPERLSVKAFPARLKINEPE